MLRGAGGVWTSRYKKREVQTERHSNEEDFPSGASPGGCKQELGVPWLPHGRCCSRGAGAGIKCGGGGSSVVPSRPCAWRGQELLRGWDVTSRLPMAPAVVGDSCLPPSGRASSRGLGADLMRRALRRGSPPCIPRLLTGSKRRRPGCGAGVVAGAGPGTAWTGRLRRGASLAKSAGGIKLVPLKYRAGASLHSRYP